MFTDLWINIHECQILENGHPRFTLKNPMQRDVDRLLQSLNGWEKVQAVYSQGIGQDALVRGVQLIHVMDEYHSGS